MRWLVPTVAYSQETYLVEYGLSESTLASISEPVDGDIDITITNAVYQVTLPSLHPFTLYYYRIKATNSIGQNESITSALTTDTAGTYSNL